MLVLLRTWSAGSVVSAKGFMLLALNPANASYVARLSGSISVCRATHTAVLATCKHGIRVLQLP